METELLGWGVSYLAIERDWLLNGIGIHVEVPRGSATLPKLRGPKDKLADDRLGETSEVIRSQVEAARAVV